MIGAVVAQLDGTNVRRSGRVAVDRSKDRAARNPIDQDVVARAGRSGEGGVAVASSLDVMVDRCHAALGEIARGNAEPWADLFSRQGDVSLGNPFGPFALGFDDVMSAVRQAAERYRDGELIGFDRIATYEARDLACVLEVEGFRARVGDSSDMADVSLRVTSLYRAEGGEWMLVHRHADPITTPRPAESVVNSGR
jgi:ketosteroid isomerase-like protein